MQQKQEGEFSDEIEKVVKYTAEITPLLSRSGKLYADALYHLNTAMRDETLEALEKLSNEKGITATAKNKLINSLCADERYLVDFSGKVYDTFEKQLNICRTLISKAKEDMRLAGMQPT